MCQSLHGILQLCYHVSSLLLFRKLERELSAKQNHSPLEYSSVYSYRVDDIVFVIHLLFQCNLPVGNDLFQEVVNFGVNFIYVQYF